MQLRILLSSQAKAFLIDWVSAKRVEKVVESESGFSIVISLLEA